MSIDLSKLDSTSSNNKERPGSVKSLLQKLQSIGTVSYKDKIFFVQNLQVMIRAGLPLDKSLKTLSEQTKNNVFKEVLIDLGQKTEKGIAFAEALKSHQKVFGELFINMVQAGEISGSLEEVLKQIHLQLKKLYELRSKVISAMIYPVIVIIAMIGIGIGMIIFVVPKITSMFNEMQAELPLPTKILIGLSDFVINNGLIVGVLSLVIISLLIFTIKSPRTKPFYHKLFLNLPVFGNIIKKINLAKFSRTISSLIKTDIPIVKAFEITSKVVGNTHYQKSLMESQLSLKQGQSITEVLKKYNHLYPPIIVQMTMAGEETGALDEIYGELAQFYEDEVDQIMKTLPSIIEPILILILGVGVAAIAVAIILPMYSLTEHIG